MANDASGDRFERFVFRFARGVYRFAAGVGTLALFGGIGCLIVSLFYLSPSLPPLPLFGGKRERPTFEQVQQRVAKDGGTAGVSDSEATGRSRESIDSSAMPDSLRKLFVAPEYPEEDEVEEICAVKTSFGCAQKSRRMVKPSAARVVFGALRSVPAADLPYVVDAAAQMLPRVEADKRALYLRALVRVDADLRSTFQLALDAHETETEQARRARDEIQRQAASTNAALLSLGLWGLGTGAVAIVAASLLLVLFAIESHLRVLRGRL